MQNIIPNAPLFRDPIYDGAADPVIIWNKKEKAWWIFYTNRRAREDTVGFSYMHGTDIGIASSTDFGKTWDYIGTAKGLEFEEGRNTFWAPEIIEHEGIYHMYVSYVRGVPTNWEHPRDIIHYTSRDLLNWEFQSILNLTSDRVIDACIIKLDEKTWKMWYKDERHSSFSYTAESHDLYSWDPGKPEITDRSHEGPNVFFFKDKFWMITDTWEGLGVYRSDDCKNWEVCPNILDNIGTRPDDGTIANHADVLVFKGRAYIFYFTHPKVSLKERRDKNLVWESYEMRRSSLQVAEITTDGKRLFCDRDNVEIDLSR